jgi:hypothetical protein
VGLLALNRTSKEQNMPFATEINHVSMYAPRNFDIYPDIYTRKGVEAAEGKGVSSCWRGELKHPYQKHPFRTFHVDPLENQAEESSNE